MSNRPRLNLDTLRTEGAKLEKAVRRREATRQAALDAEKDLRDAIRLAFHRGATAPFISSIVGLTVSRCYQIYRGTRT